MPRFAHFLFFPRMRRLAPALILSFLFGCRADFIEPGAPIVVDELIGKPWLVESSSIPGATIAGATHLFNADRTFLSYTSGRTPFCGEWSESRGSIRVQSVESSSDIFFDILSQRTDTVNLVIRGNNQSSEITYVPGQWPRTQFQREAESPPANFTPATRAGVLTGEDRDDWRETPDVHCRLSFFPAYPNPATQTDSVTVRLTVTGSTGLRSGLVLGGFDNTSTFQLLDSIPSIPRSGSYIFRFTLAKLRRLGLRRLYVIDGVGNTITYGDVMIQGV